MPAGALNESSHQWRRKREPYLFKEENLPSSNKWVA
ncbi:MAG: hypothetical protein ACKOOC_01935 [Cyanobium sp.]